MRKIPYGQKTDLGKGVSATLFDAGHILGSAYVLIEWTESGRSRSLLFTGDVGRYQHADPARSPADPRRRGISHHRKHVRQRQARPDGGSRPAASGRREILHRPQEPAAAPQLCTRADANGALVHPAIHSAKSKSPKSRSSSTARWAWRSAKSTASSANITTSPRWRRSARDDLFGLSRVTFASPTEDSKRINSQPGPCVIIASSPTCEFGRILHHLTLSVENPNDLVVFTGYIPSDTLGRRLQNGQKRVRILDRWYDVKCQIRTIHGLSAHADGDELLRFLQPDARQTNLILDRARRGRSIRRLRPSPDVRRHRPGGRAGDRDIDHRRRRCPVTAASAAAAESGGMKHYSRACSKSSKSNPRVTIVSPPSGFGGHGSCGQSPVPELIPVVG